MAPGLVKFENIGTAGKMPVTRWRTSRPEMAATFLEVP
jgi:hypothetical protein